MHELFQQIANDAADPTQEINKNSWRSLGDSLADRPWREKFVEFIVDECIFVLLKEVYSAYREDGDEESVDVLLLDHVANTENLKHVAEEAEQYAVYDAHSGVTFEAAFQERFSKMIVKECIAVLLKEVKSAEREDGEYVAIDLLLLEHFGMNLWG